MKVCSTCKQLKESSEFSTRILGSKDGLKGQCKKCVNAKSSVRFKINRAKFKAEHGISYDVHRHRNSKRACAMTMFQAARSRTMVKERYKHIECKMTSQEFIEYALGNSEFHRLYDSWQKNGYQRKLAPTIDRIDSHGHYELSNIRIITLSENSRLGSIKNAEKGREHFRRIGLIGGRKRASMGVRGEGGRFIKVD